MIPVLLQATTVADPELVEACGADPSYFCELGWDATGNEFVARAADWVISRPLAAIGIVIVTWLINRWLRRFVTAFVVRAVMSDRYAAGALERVGLHTAILGTADPRAKARARTLSAVLRATVSTVLWTVATLLVLNQFDIDLRPLLASAGIAGIAVGLGAQSLVRDCIAGFFILLEDQYGVGDTVDLGEATGTVEEVTLRSTAMRGADGTVWHVPHGQIVRVGNRTKLWSNALLDVTVSYEADLDRATAALQEVADSVCADPDLDGVVLAPPTVTGVENLTLDGAVLRVVVKTAPGQQWEVARRLRLAIKARFDEAHVPFRPTTIVRPPGLPAGDDPTAG